MRFQADLTLRQVTGKELIEVLKDDRVSLLERARQFVTRDPIIAATLAMRRAMEKASKR